MTVDEKEKLIQEINKLLHQLLGVGIIKVNFLDNEFREFPGDEILDFASPQDTIDLFKSCNEKNLKLLYRIFYFYYPRWLSYKCIQLDDSYDYKYYAADNELLLALTSIVDYLANDNFENKYCLKCGRPENGFLNKFVNFIKKNLSEVDIRIIINSGYILKNGKRQLLNSVEDFSKYIYDVRSRIVHKIELQGMYLFNIDWDDDIDWKRLEQHNDFKEEKKIYQMIQPEDFRKYIWKAIFNHFGLQIIN